MCMGETPCVGNVGGPFEGAMLAPILVDHTVSFLHFDDAEFDDVVEAVVGAGSYVCGCVSGTLYRLQR